MKQQPECIPLLKYTDLSVAYRFCHPRLSLTLASAQISAFQMNSSDPVQGMVPVSLWREAPGRRPPSLSTAARHTAADDSLQQCCNHWEPEV